MLAGNELINTAVIIVRYFGGIKLGTGGLVRAYGDSVNEVIKIAEFKEYQKLINKTLICDYAELSKLEYLLNQEDINIKKEDPTKIEIFTEEKIKAEESAYNLFGLKWKEVKSSLGSTFADANTFKLADDRKSSISLKAVKEDDEKSRTILRTNLETMGSNSVSGTFTLVDAGIKSSGILMTFVNVTLSDAVKSKYSSLSNDIKLYIQAKVYNDRIYSSIGLTDGTNSVILGENILDSNLTNTSKSFTISQKYVEDKITVSVDGINSFEFDELDGITIGEFTSADFRAEVDDSSQKATDDKDASIKVTGFKAETKTLSAAIKAMKIVANTDIEKDNVETKLAQAQALVKDVNANDAKMVKNMLDLTSVMNSSEVTKVLEIDSSSSSIGETTNFGKLVKSTVVDSISLSEKYEGITSTARVVMHDLAGKLKTISDSIDAVYVDEDYEFEYGSEKITYHDSLALRSGILALAFKLDFIAAYSWGDDEDIKTRTKVINGITYEYANMDIRPDTVLNKGSVFKIDNAARLDGARAYLIEGLDLANKLPVGYDDSTQDDKDELTAIINSVKNGTDYEDKSTWEEWDGSKMVEKSEIFYVNLAKAFNSTTAIDITSFGSNFVLECEYDGGTYSENSSIIHANPTCDNGPAEIVPSTLPTTATSRLDDVITKVVDQGKTYTGQGVIDYLIGDDEE